MSWALITGEYPPQTGGVSDYTRNLARMLAAGRDCVTVFAPPCDGESPHDDNVRVVRLPDAFASRGRTALRAALLEIPAPRAAIVQYVPQSFGMRGCNLPFSSWLRSLHGYPLWVMFHEVTVTVRPSTPLKYRIQALATRAMARHAIAAADAAFVSTERWEPLLRGLSSSVPSVTCLPVPSNIALHADALRRSEIRARFTCTERPLLYGHFGTYQDATMRQTLRASVPRLLRHAQHAAVLFLGAGSDAFAAGLCDTVPALRGRIFASGALGSDDLADQLAACDVLLQPYEDGVTTRRGSIIAALALGSAVVTTGGPMTEALWRDSGAVVLAPDGDLDTFVKDAFALGLDVPRRTEMGSRARDLYARTFALEHTVAALKQRVLQERLLPT